jgi:hypothetical protein
MKTFEQLKPYQREQALKTSLYTLIDGIVDGILEIELADAVNQKQLQHVMLMATRRDDTRLAKMGLLSNKGIRKELERLALVIASTSQYDADGYLVMEVEDL